MKERCIFDYLEKHLDNVEYLSLSLINCFGLMSFSISNGGVSKPKEKKRKEKRTK